MIAREAEGVCRRQVGCFRITVCLLIARSSQGRLNQALVSNAIQPAVLGQLPVMDCIHQIGANPPPLAHFASARRISRSSCIISSAKAI